MKKAILAFYCLLFSFGISKAQNVYSSSGSEMIFSFANSTMENSNGDQVDAKNIVRWAPVINLQSYINYDMSKKAGIFTGLFLRNVGFISDIPQDTYLNNPVDPSTPLNNVRYKFRSYNIGIPLGLKLGTMNKSFIYGGYEIAYSFNYKEKRFVDGSKSNNSVYWFGDANKRVEPWQHGFFVGIQFPYGANIKFKYYVNNFFVQDYRDSAGNQPYQGFESNVFYFSLSFNVLKNTDFYYYNPEADYEELSLK
jgi:hypothetical protein